MPLSLDDLRKSTTANRKDKRRYVVPQLLENSEETSLCEDFCRYFAQIAQDGRTQKDFSEQYLTERATGDFKLARGLITAMLRYYSWESQTFSDKLAMAEVERLQEIGLSNPSTLRLALYDYVNQSPMSGFAGSTEWERADTLDLFAAGIGFEPDKVEELLWLDAEENAKLKLRRRKDGELFRVPDGAEVARHYNRLAIETLLYNSTEINFNLGQNLPVALMKRIGYFCKDLRIPYDLEYNSVGEIQLRLYGPAEAFGPPTKHGEKLARLAFIVLALSKKAISGEWLEGGEGESYEGPRTTILDEKPAKTTKKSSTKKGEKASPIRSAIASVVLRDKLYHFDLQNYAHTFARPEETEEIATEATAETPAIATPNAIRETKASYSVTSDFDSSVEARFYEEFSALEREGQTTGWQLEREPEAVAVPEENLLFIPDFGLRRGKRRVLLEIIGFWTPAYRARKLEKLEKLKRRGGFDLLLGVAQELKTDFKDAPFPLLFYKNSLKPTELLALLNRHYADLEERLSEAHKGLDRIGPELTAQGFIPETALYKLLGSYSKSELLNALQKTGLSNEENKTGLYIESYGFCATNYLVKATVELGKALQGAPNQKLAPEEVAASLQAANLKIDAGRIEALITRLPGFKVNRQSLFEVFVEKG